MVGGPALAAVARLGLEVIDQVHNVVAACPSPVADAGPGDGHAQMRLAGSRSADQHEVAFVAQERAGGQIMIHRIDYRPRPASCAGSVVIYSERKFALHRAAKLKLGTPYYYRDSGQLKAGIQDSHDGLLRRDLTPWATNWAKQGAPSVNVRSASISFAAVSEPWIRCASHYRSTADLRRLRDHFESRYGYTDATTVHYPADFALRLGIECALQLDKRVDVELSALERSVYEQSSYRTDLWEGSHPIDTFVNVYHGPVHYADH